MQYVVIATMRRGTLEKSEPLDDENSLRVESTDIAFRSSQKKRVERERDPYLTSAEWSEIEGSRALYVRRKRVG